MYCIKVTLLLRAYSRALHLYWRKVLTSNGLACNERGNEAEAETRAPASEEGLELSPNEQAMIDLANCQFAEAQAELSPEEFTRFEQEITDELIETIQKGADTDIQTLLLEGIRLQWACPGIIGELN